MLFQRGRDDHEYPADWVELLAKFDLSNIIGHGVLDIRGTFGSYFVFACLNGEVGEREVFLLKLIIPHLHLALMRIVASGQEFGKITEPARTTISQRQHEILHHLNQGKTNREIAEELSMTEKNVKYHVEQIFSKLEVRNRAQAVSKAMLLGLLG